MKDCNGRELKQGQKVVFSTNGNLMTGTVAKLRDGKRRGVSRSVVKVSLDVPKPKKPIRRGRYVRVNGEVVFEHGTWVNGPRDVYGWRERTFVPCEAPPEPAPHLTLDIYSEKKILILDSVE
jgi:hypothetical protein